MLQSWMVFWFPSAKWGRNLVQSLHSIFWVDMSFLCPRIWAAICVAMVVQGWSWLQPAPRRALWLWLFQGDKACCGVSCISATVCALRPPLPPTACVMVRLRSLQHHSGPCLKPLLAPGFYFCLVPCLWCCMSFHWPGCTKSKFFSDQDTWLEDMSQGNFILVYSEKRIAK